MRKCLTLCAALLFWSVPSHATWTLVQHPRNNNCASTTTCTITLTQNTGTGHLIVIGLTVFSTSGTPTISSVNAGAGTFVANVSACSIHAGAGSQTGVSCTYTLASVSGAASITINYSNGNATSGFTRAAAFEYSFTGSSIALDTANKADDGTATNPAGVALTLTGTNDIIAQYVCTAGTASAISGAYTNPADFQGGDGWAGAINTTTGTAPTWTATATGSSVSAAAIAFNEVSNGHCAACDLSMLLRQGLRSWWSRF